MWGEGFVHGLGGGSLPWGLGGGRLPPPKAVSSGAEGGFGDELSKPNIAPEGRWQFPIKAGVTSGGLALVGDTAAQFVSRYKRSKALQGSVGETSTTESVLSDETFWHHDWVRAARMGSYGFLCYGPLSHGWYQFLDQTLPVKNFVNFLVKVTLNQIVLGPVVISIVFAWNALWTKRLKELPNQYRTLALPTLIDGWKFWTPVTFLNFGIIPLDARVAFMSSCAVFWNFYLSTAVSKKSA